MKKLTLAIMVFMVSLSAQAKIVCASKSRFCGVSTISVKLPKKKDPTISVNGSDFKKAYVDADMGTFVKADGFKKCYLAASYDQNHWWLNEYTYCDPRDNPCNGCNEPDVGMLTGGETLKCHKEKD